MALAWVLAWNHDARPAVMQCSFRFVISKQERLSPSLVIYGLWRLDWLPLSYNITGGGAPIFRQSKKCRQKHGGFSRLLIRHLVPFGHGIYHWQTAILCFWRCLSPPWIFDKKCFCFELKMFFSYFACFTKSRKKCLSYPLVDAIQYAINEEYFLQVRCIF
jgi:hypothetical protein